MRTLQRLGGSGGGGMGGYGGGAYGGGGYGYPAFGGFQAQAYPGQAQVPGGLVGTAGAAAPTAGQGAAGTPGIGQQPGEEQVAPPIVVPNPLDNSLLIRGNAQQYQSVLKLLQQLDHPPRQILLEAKVYEVILSNVLCEWHSG